jgi:hypothetical protein
MMTIPVPPFFELKINMYAQSTHEREDRTITGPPSALLSFAFQIIEQVVATSVGVR